MYRQQHNSGLWGGMFHYLFPGQQGGPTQPPPPYGPPGTGGGQPGGPPSSPPPSFTPQLSPEGTGQISTYAVDPGGIRGCLYRNTYIWLRGGRSFWYYPTFVGRQSIAGWRWTGYNWVYFGVDLDRIRSFQCYG